MMQYRESVCSNFFMVYRIGCYFQFEIMKCGKYLMNNRLALFFFINIVVVRDQSNRVLTDDPATKSLSSELCSG